MKQMITYPIIVAFLVLTACGAANQAATGADATQPIVDSSKQIVASLTRSGGMQGKTETLVIAGDGTLTIRAGDPNGAIIRTAQAPPAQIESLRATFASRDWQQLAASYGRQAPDGYAYTIRAGNTQVQTYDGAQNPPVLDTTLSQLNKLWQIALDG